jgi:hypothetical protein
MLNKAMSLAVVLAALPARLASVPLAALATHWTIAVNPARRPRDRRPRRP